MRHVSNNLSKPSAKINPTSFPDTMHSSARFAGFQEVEDVFVESGWYLRKNLTNEYSVRISMHVNRIKEREDTEGRYYLVKFCDFTGTAIDSLEIANPDAAIELAKNLASRYENAFNYFDAFRLAETFPIEKTTHGSPQCPSIEINPTEASETKPQAWLTVRSGLSGNSEHWHYNQAGAQAEAQFLGRKLPTCADWNKLFNFTEALGAEALRKIVGVRETGISKSDGFRNGGRVLFGISDYYWASENGRCARIGGFTESDGGFGTTEVPEKIAASIRFLKS